MGRKPAAATSPVHPGWPVRAVTRMPTATVCIQEPTLESRAETQMRAKLRRRSGARATGTAVPHYGGALKLRPRLSEFRDMAEPASSIRRGARAAEGSGWSPDPGALEDLLYLASLAWEAPRVLLALPDDDEGWTLHAGGERHNPVLDRPLLETISAGDGPVEVADLPAARPDSPLVIFPHSMRWVYGLALRDPGGRTVAILAVMDRWIRSANGRDRKVMQLVARQLRSRFEAPRIGPATAGPVGAGPQATVAVSRPAFDADALMPRRGVPRDVHAKLLRSSEVAALFDVTERTVINWATAGKLPSIRTVGGHLRFRQDDIMEMISGPV